MASSSSETKEDIDDLREEVKEFKPGMAVRAPDRIDFPERLFIGLFGRTGCGKTSLINSLKFAASGRLRRAKWLQVATQEKAGGHTMYRKLADLTQSIFVIDNRGLDEPDTNTAIAELEAQLDGVRGYGEKVEWQGGKGDADTSSDDVDVDIADDPSERHRISCAVFVFSALHDIATNTNGLFEVVDFLHAHQGRYPVGVITHVDVAEKKAVENLTLALRMAGISDIFEVANITNEKKRLEDAYQLSLLSLIERCMTDGDETIIFKHYQQKERDRRREAERRKLEKERQQAQEQRLRQESEARAQEARRQREEERKLQEVCLQLEQQKLEYENRLDLERHKIEMERERQRMQAEERAREQEREKRFQEAMRQVESEKQAELFRIMRENQRSSESSCSLM